jgi:hypothetical protein
MPTEPPRGVFLLGLRLFQCPRGTPAPARRRRRDEHRPSSPRIPSCRPARRGLLSPRRTPEEKAAIDNPLFDQVRPSGSATPTIIPNCSRSRKNRRLPAGLFQNPPSPQKGLCSWFEKSITTDIDWARR